MSAAKQFRDKIAPVYYRRKREDVLKELPEKIETREWCTLGPEEEKIYEDFTRNKKFMDMRRVSWNIDDLTLSAKANRLREIAEEAEEDGRKILVFSFFLDTIEKVSSLFGDKCMPYINGSLSPEKRQSIIDDFEKAPAGTILPAQIQSGGTGLNIQSASVVVICEPQLKPSIENQAISRAYRMGQSRNVLVYRLLADDTVDERLLERLEEKQKEFDAFADLSAAAAESFELDKKLIGDIIQEEIDRINAKNGYKAEDTDIVIEKTSDSQDDT
jgi:SNF2 family DNA or RNA helicase